MALVEKSVLIGFSAEQMFDLVAKIEDYPTFMPWCDGAQVRSREQLSAVEERVVGTLKIRYAGLGQSFTTENTQHRGESIRLRLIDGPFKMLSGDWRFIALAPDACRVEFRLQYEFASRLLEGLIGPVFGGIANSFIDSFSRRAEQVYGSDVSD
ncbi:type II toxin-antitoxin system RatA family toxin [soil metagenome]